MAAENKPISQMSISKVAAAQRQLDAAIRMMLIGEDILAITTIAAASYRLLRDVRAHEGRHVLSEEWKHDVVGTARAFVRGELSEREISIFKADPSWSLIEDLSRFIEETGPDLTMDELCERVTLDIPASTEKEFWRKFNRIPNFLKHADADVHTQIGEEEIDPRMCIMRGLSLYSDLTGEQTPEMQVWYALELCTHADTRPNYEPIITMISKLESVPNTMQKHFAMEMITALKRIGLDQ